MEIKHERKTRGIVNKGFSGSRSVVARIKLCFRLIGKKQFLTNHTATVRGNPPYKQLITYSANGKHFDDDIRYICITLCKADLSSVAFKHERNPG